jgi:hypothetical protein
MGKSKNRYSTRYLQKICSSWGYVKTSSDNNCPGNNFKGGTSSTEEKIHSYKSDNTNIGFFIKRKDF